MALGCETGTRGTTGEAAVGRGRQEVRRHGEAWARVRRLHCRGGARWSRGPVARLGGHVRRGRPRHHAARRNGYEICADLRGHGDWTPVLMLTAKDGDLDEAEALDTGADDYLTKPFSFPVLVART